MAEPVNEIPKEFAEIFAGISRIYKENKNNPDARPFISWITVIKGLLEKIFREYLLSIPISEIVQNLLALGDSEGEVAPFGFEAIGATQDFSAVISATWISLILLKQMAFRQMYAQRTSLL